MVVRLDPSEQFTSGAVGTVNGAGLGVFWDSEQFREWWDKVSVKWNTLGSVS